MADEKRDAPRPFDVRTVEYLLKLMAEHDLGEVDLKEGDQRIRLRKGGMTAPVYAPAPHPVASAPPSAASAPAPTAPPAAPAKKYLEIKSPMVGSFYTRPDPKKPEYVTVGAKVTPKSVVCTIEAMKLYNEVHAECTGTVVEVCKQPGDFVEFGTVLFRIDPS